MATQLAGEGFLAGLDHLRVDTAGTAALLICRVYLDLATWRDHRQEDHLRSVEDPRNGHPGACGPLHPGAPYRRMQTLPGPKSDPSRRVRG
jgi:hypothetical protein